jgi:secreted PhoX family phosphatase
MYRQRRREFLRASLVGVGTLAFGPAFWREALAAEPATPGPGPYGPLQPPDENGIMLPPGFRSRVIARGGQPVAGTTYEWHVFSDGQATFRTEDGGFILVSNSENPPDVGATVTGGGGASAIRFTADGSIAAAYRILGGTSVNCAGGATPWGTWLSCEEHQEGRVWECDPTGGNPGVARPAMGVFEHEAVAVDPAGRRVYLSEDNGAGGFYRFTPDRYPDLDSGVLEVARVGADGFVAWARVPDPGANATPTRAQVQGMTQFNRGEGMWYDGGVVYLCTTNDHRIHAYDTATERIEALYDGSRLEDPPLTNVDNVTVSRSGDLFVCEDTTSSADPGLDIGLITPDREVSRFLKVTGSMHIAAGEARSELCGVVFDPSGTRMFFSSQRGLVTGIIYEVTGPFRLERPRGPRRRGFRVHVPSTVTTRTLLGRGLPFSVVTGKPVDVAATLTARFPASANVRGGVAPAGRTRVVTLARAHREIGAAGREKLQLRPQRSARSRVRARRSFRARATITVTDRTGNRRVIRRSVRVARRFGGR